MDSKKLLVLSDTHGNINALKSILKWARGLNIGDAVFLGDGIEDLSPASDAAGFAAEWKLVRGNNDFLFSVPEAAVFDFEGTRFFMCHGHRYALYNGYHTLSAAARNREANAVLFGHTHVPYLEKENGITLINPGSIGRPRSNAGATFATIECTAENPIQVSFWRIGRGSQIQKL